MLSPTPRPNPSPSPTTRTRPRKSLSSLFSLFSASSPSSSSSLSSERLPFLYSLLRASNLTTSMAKIHPILHTRARANSTKSKLPTLGFRPPLATTPTGRGSTTRAPDRRGTTTPARRSSRAGTASPATNPMPPTSPSGGGSPRNAISRRSIRRPFFALTGTPVLDLLVIP